jgi:predicted membrane chloride channel (bestrophin family)
VPCLRARVPVLPASSPALLLLTVLPSLDIVRSGADIGASERLLKTPVPFGLVLHLRWVMIFYIICVPLYLAGPGLLGWGAVPVTVLFAYTLTGLEDIAQSIENPFRQNWHCLPIDGICAAIRSNVLEIQGRHVDGGTPPAAVQHDRESGVVAAAGV